MKRFVLLTVILALVLLPTASAFAAAPPAQPNIPPGCNPQMVLETLIFRLTLIEEPQDFADFLMYAGDKLLDCGGAWLELLIMQIFGGGMMMPMMPPPVEGFDAPTDGVLSGDAVENAVLSAFNGDLSTINALSCPEEWLTEEDLITLPDGLEIVSIACERAGDEMVCDYTLSTAGSEYSDSVTFIIEDEQLCGER